MPVTSRRPSAGVLSAPGYTGFGPALDPRSTAKQSVIPGAPVALSSRLLPARATVGFFNGVPIAGQTTSVLTINSVVLNQGGTYSSSSRSGASCYLQSRLLQVQPLNNGTVFPRRWARRPSIWELRLRTSSDTYTLNSLPPIVGLSARCYELPMGKKWAADPWSHRLFLHHPATSATDAGIYTVAAANGLVTLQSAGSCSGVNGAPGATFLDS